MTWEKRSGDLVVGTITICVDRRARRDWVGEVGALTTSVWNEGLMRQAEREWWHLLYQLSRLSVRWDWTRALGTCLQKYTINKGVTARTYCLTEYPQRCSQPWARLKKYLHRLQGHCDPNMPLLVWDPAVVKEISDCADTQEICSPHFFIRDLKTNFNQLKDVCKQPSSTLTSNK